MLLIICPNCATSYEVEPSTVGAAGRSVRCVRCRTVWVAGAQQHALESAEASPEPALPPASADPMAPAEPEAALPDPPENPSLSAIEEAIAEAERVVAETVDVPPAVDDRGPADMIHSPPLVPPQEPDPAAETGDTEQPEPDPPFVHNGHDIETIVARRAKNILTRKRRRLSSIGLPALIVTLIAVVSALLIWRKDVVRFAPQTASLYRAIGLRVNLRGLTFANIKTTKDAQEGVPVLVVEGQIIAETRQPVEIPRLRFAIRNAAGYEIYSWTAIATRTALGPGEALDFRSRLASPPVEGRDVVVRFFNRRDMLAGAR